MKRLILALLFCSSANAVTITDVGVLATPSVQPRCSTLNGSISYACNAQWTMKSSCSDVNEAGTAACTVEATAPDYRCSINRFAPKCKNYKSFVARFENGVLTELASSGLSRNINSLGDISSSAGLFRTDGTVVPGSVIWTNDLGDYIQEDAAVIAVSTWYTVFTDTVKQSDGTVIPFAGLPSPYGGLDGSMPTVIGNNGQIAGLQMLERAGSGGHLEHYTAGTGLFLSQTEIDNLEKNQDGWILAYSSTLYPFRAVTPYISAGNTLYINDRSYVFDINDNNDFIAGIQGQRYFFESSQVCTVDGCFTPDFSPTGLNNYGIYVGGGHFVGMLGFTLDLNTMDEVIASGYVVTKVTDITDNGQISGTCTKNGVAAGCIISL
jgi:hypothetical protein